MVLQRRQAREEKTAEKAHDKENIKTSRQATLQLQKELKNIFPRPRTQFKASTPKKRVVIVVDSDNEVEVPLTPGLHRGRDRSVPKWHEDYIIGQEFWIEYLGYALFFLA